jgi:hypothetical protein
MCKMLRGVLKKANDIKFEPNKDPQVIWVGVGKLVLSKIPLHAVDRTSHRQLRGWGGGGFSARDPLYAVTSIIRRASHNILLFLLM